MTFRTLLLWLLLALWLPAGQRELQVEFPNGGEVLAAGSEIRIRWRSLGISGDLAILLFKNGEQYAMIAASAPDSGSYQWQIPATLPSSGQYRLRISWLRDLRVNDFSDRDFAIKK